MSSSFISLGAALHSFVPSAVRSHGKHKRSRSMPTSRVHPIVADFQCQLQAKLEILIQQQPQQPEPYNISTAWLGKALDVVLFIYSSLKDLHPHIMPIDSNVEGKWLSQHMEDLVNLLDVCNVLRECMSEIKKHNTSVQIALHGLLHAHAQMNNQVVKAKDSLDKCMDELRKNKDMESRLAKCMSTLKRMADSLHTTTAIAASMDGSGVEEAIKEAKAITIFVCTALVASLSFNTPCRSFMPGAGFLKTKKSISPTSLPSLMDINSMTNMMQQKLKDAMEMQRKSSSSLFRFLLHELNNVDITIGNLNNLLERYIMNRTSKSSSNMQDELMDSIHVVYMSTIEFESALTHIDQRMNEIFKFMISSRVALLNNISALSS